jgi:hypothetical protein
MPTTAINQFPRGKIVMAYAITALIGALMMIGYVFLIAAKLAALPLWICTMIGVALVLCAFCGDDWQPTVKRFKK